jgi:hypothetical protein
MRQVCSIRVLTVWAESRLMRPQRCTCNNVAKQTLAGVAE